MSLFNIFKIKKFPLTCIQGTNEIPEESCSVEIIKEGLLFENKKYKLTISKNRIKNIEINKELESTEKNKSVIGRAIVGGLLLGPVGAVVGGMSGIGSNANKKEKFYLIINYDDKQVIFKNIFETNEANNRLNEFVSDIKKQLMIN